MVSLSKFFSLLVLGLTGTSMAVMFQNCGTTEVGTNYLYEQSVAFGCIGMSCDVNLDQVSFKSTVSAVMIDKPAAAAPSASASCNSSNCFDLGGYCETGGYANSVFFYQWFISNNSGAASPLQEIRTIARCDENGRFHVQVKVPSNISGFYDRSHRLRLFMKVIDETGSELANPTMEADFSYMVSVRN